MLKVSFWLPVILVTFIFFVCFFVFGFTYNIQCPECGGYGKVMCGYCDGQGQKEMPIWTEGGTILWVLDDCPVCGGAGTVSCNPCEGTGDFWMLLDAFSYKFISAVFPSSPCHLFCILSSGLCYSIRLFREKPLGARCRGDVMGLL